MTFRKQLREWREKCSHSQPEASKLLGVPLATYRNWEQGRNDPPEFCQTMILNKLAGLTGKETLA